MNGELTFLAIAFICIGIPGLIFVAYLLLWDDSPKQDTETKLFIAQRAKSLGITPDEYMQRHYKQHHAEITCGCGRQHRVTVDGQAAYCPICGHIMAAHTEKDGRITKRFEYLG